MKTYHVVSREDGKWAVIKEGAKRAASLHEKKTEAVSEAKRLGQQSLPQTRKNTPSSIANSLAVRVGERVKRARLMRGLPLRGLADALGQAVSHTTLQKYENGQAIPDTEILGKLASALNLRPDYFLKKNTLTLKGVEYRKQTKLGAKRQTQLEEEAFEFFERYLEIEGILNIPRPDLPRFDLSNKAVCDIPAEIEKITCKIRKDWKLGLNPISNVHAMLEENSVKVKLLPAFDGFDGFSAFATTGSEDVPTVALSKKWLNDLPRLRFTALHELGHLVMRLPEGLEAKITEGFCHRFASAFLFPQVHFLEVFGESRVNISVQELGGIKKEWGISFAATMRRALDLGCITPGRYKSYCFFASKSGWRTTEPTQHGAWQGDEQSDRFKQLVLRALAEKLITTSKACGLLELSQDELAAEFELLG